MESLTESHIQQQVIIPPTKITDLKQGLRSTLHRHKLFYELSFKQVNIKIINTISNIKETEIRISTWKQNKVHYDRVKQNINTLQNDLDNVKIMLINDLKEKIKLVRTLNQTYNNCLNQLIKLEILPNYEIEQCKDLPIKMLQENCVQGLPELLIQCNMLSPYLKRRKSQDKKQEIKQSQENLQEIVTNNQLK